MESLYREGKTPIAPRHEGTPAEALQGKANERIFPEGRRP
jgi:hypothetical protein